MRRRTGDSWALLAILVGTAIGWRLSGDFFRGDRFEVAIERRYVRAHRFERRFERVRRGSIPAACEASFAIDSRGPGWAVTGQYEGTASWDDRGLAIRFTRAAASAQYEDRRVRGVVVGLAQETAGGQWSLTHQAEAVPLGELPEGATRAVPISGLVIPGVTPADLAVGWLVVEHMVDAPELDGGTSWTYAHAPRSALAPLQNAACLAESLLP